MEKVVQRNVSTLRIVNLYVLFDDETDGRNYSLVTCLTEIKRILIVRDEIIKQSMAAMTMSFEKIGEFALDLERKISEYMAIFLFPERGVALNVRHGLSTKFPVPADSGACKGKKQHCTCARSRQILWK